MEENKRPSWDDYFLDIADAVSKRATCNRGKTGCVFTKDNQILVTGYVGAPKGLPHCDEVRTVHAEQNAIAQAARRGIALEGATLYCRMTPCRVCAMMLINCGIVRVVCERRYHEAAETEEMFKKVGIELVYKYHEIQKY